jgi:hypothetical protein
MKATVLVGAFLIISEQVALGFQEPDGFLGIKWGTSVEDARKTLQNISSNHFSGFTDLGGGKLVFTDSLGGVITKFHFSFENDKFTDVLLRFDSKDFQTMEEIFVKRYGKAAQSDTSAVANAMATKFVNKKLYWLGKTVYIYLFKYGNTIRDGGAIIAPISQLHEIERQKNRAIEDAVKTM